MRSCGLIGSVAFKYIMSIKNLFTLSLCLMLPALVWGQGTIRGKVTSGEDGEPLTGATVRLQQNGQVVGGAYADLDGAFTIKTNPGTYEMVVSYVTYLDDTVQVDLEEGGVFSQEFVLFTSVQDEIIITAKSNQASEVSLFSKKRASINTVDGVSTDLIARTGDNNVAAAMQRISGVTVEGGKYVYVRGLGDRYSKAMMNGAVIPNLDPNRNSVQLDIIPANLIDNILVYKTFTPDLPGDFTGGLIDVATKDYPNQFGLNFTAGLGFNPQANLINDFLTYETGNNDWLGFDDGTRALPDFIANLPNGVPPRGAFDGSNPENVAQADVIQDASRSFQTGMDPMAMQGNNFLNQNYQFSIGNQFLLGDRPLGVIAGFSYRNSFQAYNGFTQDLDDPQDQYRVARWKNTGTAANPSTSLLNLREHVTQYGSRAVLWGGLARVSFKPTDKHSFSINYLRNQSGESEAMFLEGPLPEEDEGLIFQTRRLGWMERSLNSIQASGKHQFGEEKEDGKIGPLKADWIFSYTLSNQEEPDLRFFSNDFREDDEGNRIYDIQANAYPLPTRFYRQLEETNTDSRLNFELPFKQWSGLNAKLKFGGAYTTKDRDFAEFQYRYAQGASRIAFEGEADDYIADGNLGYSIFEQVIRDDTVRQIRYKNFLQDASEDRNRYVGEQSVLAAYLMTTLPLTGRLETTFGARYEQTEASTVSGDSTAAEGNLNLQDLLPAISFKYAINEKMNLRASYTRTLARPTFREFSSFVSFAFVGDFLLRGNPGLRRTLIDNIDLRYEFYPSPSELISFSAFYKNFTDPIERIIVAQAANLELTYVNVDQALTYGVEFEVRKNFSFISEALKNFQIGGNISLINSSVDLDPQLLQQIRSVDSTRESTRPLYGQSPYAVNAELAYLDPVGGWKGSLSYSVFGPRLVAVGGINPDIYEQPRALLNFSLSKDIRLSKGGRERLSVRFRANNLLNPFFRQTQTYLGEDYIYENYQLGRSYSLSLSFKI
jgi:TonB-dependent receptor